MALDVVAVSDCNGNIHSTDFHINFEEDMLDYATMSILGIHTRRNHVSQGRTFFSRGKDDDQSKRNLSTPNHSANSDKSVVQISSETSVDRYLPNHHQVAAARRNVIEPEWCDIFCNDQKCPEILAFIGPDNLLTFMESSPAKSEKHEGKASSLISSANIGESKVESSEPRLFNFNLNLNLNGEEKVSLNEQKSEGKFSRTPSSTTLKFLHLNKGCNKVSCKNRASGSTADFSVFLYDRTDKIVIMDVDGTVTRSDIRGYVESVYFGIYDYTHDGIVAFLNSVSESCNCHVLYLTSRPISHLRETRLLLQNARDTGAEGRMLPVGPVFANTETMITAAYRELIAKNTVALKSSILLNISKVFKTACSITRRPPAPTLSADVESRIGVSVPHPWCTPFLFGIGNKVADAIAYKLAGVVEGNILIIDPTSTLRVWVDTRVNDSARESSINEKLGVSEGDLITTVFHSAAEEGDTNNLNSGDRDNFSINIGGNSNSNSNSRSNPNSSNTSSKENRGIENDMKSDRMTRKIAFSSYSDPSLLQYLKQISYLDQISNSTLK
jgi:phosphatidate phosphatase PAH1